MNNPAYAHLTIKWNTQDTGGSNRGWWACEMCHTLFVPQTIEPSLQQRLEQANKLQELTLQSQIRWMKKYGESEKAHQETRAALESANSLCRSAHSIAERKGSQTNWDSFIGQLKESLKIQHRVIYPEGRVIFPQPSPSPEQIKQAEAGAVPPAASPQQQRMQASKKYEGTSHAALDASNLEWYASLFREKQWQTEVVHWSVFCQTLTDIAKRLRESQFSSIPCPHVFTDGRTAWGCVLPVGHPGEHQEYAGRAASGSGIATPETPATNWSLSETATFKKLNPDQQGGSSEGAIGLLASPICPKCRSRAVKVVFSLTGNSADCYECTYSGEPSEFFPASSGRDVKELAGRIAAIAVDDLLSWRDDCDGMRRKVCIEHVKPLIEEELKK